MRPSNNLENKTPSDTYWRVQLVCTKFQARNSLEPPLKYNQDQTHLMNQSSSLWPFSPSWELLKYYAFLILDGQTGKELPESSKLEFLEKFLKNNFALSDAEDTTSWSLNKGSTTDLPLLRTLLLAIRQKSRGPSFWEVMDSVLLAYANLAASRTLLQRLLFCLNLTLAS